MPRRFIRPRFTHVFRIVAGFPGRKRERQSGRAGTTNLVGLLLAASVFNSLPSPAAPLPDVLRQVLQRHPDIRSSQALLKAAEEEVAVQRSTYYPTIGITSLASNGIVEQFGVPLSQTSRTTDGFLRWNLFHGLADRHAVRAAEDTRNASDADLAETQENVALDLTEAYLDVLRLRQMIAVGEDYIADQKRLGDEIHKRARAGRVPMSDVEQALVSLIQAERQQSLMNSQLRAAEQRYRLLAETDPVELTEPALAKVPEGTSLAALMDDLLTGNGRVRADRERAKARGEEIEVASAALYPSLDMEITHRLQSKINPVSVTDTRSNNQLQLSYQIPLGGGNISRKREAVQRQQAALATVDTTLLRVRTELGQRWETWSQARDMAPRLIERLAASNKVVQAYDLQFESGRRSLPDLISVRSERYQADIDLIENHIQQLDASARMLSLAGQLRQTLLGANCDPTKGC